VGYTVDRRACTTYKKKIGFGHEGLGSAQTYRKADFTNFEHRGRDVARFAFRIRVEMDQNGLPTRAQLAIVRARTGASLMYVDWTPDKVIGYARGAARRPADDWTQPPRGEGGMRVSPVTPSRTNPISST
jgi:hypothetical protein